MDEGFRAFSVAKPLIRPVIYERAFEDPEAVRAVVGRNGPYKWIGAFTGQTQQASATPLTAWFRETWDVASAGTNGRDIILNNPLFVEGSRESFVGFEIVRTESVRVNLMTPMPTQPAHFDNPYFRGLDHSNTPYAILMAMGRSELFERWQINVSTALSWLYDGQGGGFTYWAAGPDAVPSQILPPMNNRVLISDNQRMYHRVEAISAAAEPFTFYDPQAVLIGEGQDWKFIGQDGDRVIPRQEMRISLLWKALMFRDAEEMRIHDAHLDDITLETALDILESGARERGVKLPKLTQLYGDETYVRALFEAFPISRKLPEPA